MLTAAGGRPIASDHQTLGRRAARTRQRAARRCARPAAGAAAAASRGTGHGGRRSSAESNGGSASRRASRPVPSSHRARRLAELVRDRAHLHRRNAAAGGSAEDAEALHRLDRDVVRRDPTAALVPIGSSAASGKGGPPSRPARGEAAHGRRRGSPRRCRRNAPPSRSRAFRGRGRVHRRAHVQDDGWAPGRSRRPSRRQPPPARLHRRARRDRRARGRWPRRARSRRNRYGGSPATENAVRPACGGPKAPGQPSLRVRHTPRVRIPRAPLQRARRAEARSRHDSDAVPAERVVVAGDDRLEALGPSDCPLDHVELRPRANRRRDLAVVLDHRRPRSPGLKACGGSRSTARGTAPSPPNARSGPGGPAACSRSTARGTAPSPAHARPGPGGPAACSRSTARGTAPSPPTARPGAWSACGE